MQSARLYANDGVSSCKQRHIGMLYAFHTSTSFVYRLSIKTTSEGCAGHHSPHETRISARSAPTAGYTSRNDARGLRIYGGNESAGLLESVRANEASPTKLLIFIPLVRFRSILSAKTLVKMPISFRLWVPSLLEWTSCGTLALNPLVPKRPRRPRHHPWNRTPHLYTHRCASASWRSTRPDDIQQNGTVYYLYTGERAERV